MNKAWGGSRPGAGRKPQGETEMVVFTVKFPKAEADEIKRRAEAAGEKRNAFLKRAIREFLKGKV